MNADSERVKIVCDLLAAVGIASQIDPVSVTVSHDILAALDAHDRERWADGELRERLLRKAQAAYEGVPIPEGAQAAVQAVVDTILAALPQTPMPARATPEMVNAAITNWYRCYGEFDDHAEEVLNTALAAAPSVRMYPKQIDDVTIIFQTDDYHKQHGTIRVSIVPEGVQFWCGGEIRWRSYDAPREAELDLPDADFIQRVRELWEAANDAQLTIEQAADCLRGETPEDMTHAEAQENTYERLKSSDERLGATLTALRPDIERMRAGETNPDDFDGTCQCGMDSKENCEANPNGDCGVLRADHTMNSGADRQSASAGRNTCGPERADAGSGRPSGPNTTRGWSGRTLPELLADAAEQAFKSKDGSIYWQTQVELLHALADREGRVQAVCERIVRDASGMHSWVAELAAALLGRGE